MAVYTRVGDGDLAAFVADYDIGPVVACKGIAEGVENSNYLLVTGAGNYVLTLYEKRVRAADLPFFMALLDHLAARGVPCPTPVHGRDGGVLRPLAGRTAAIVTFLAGMSPRKPTAAHCAEVGAAMATMHAAAADFAEERANDLSIAAWRPLLRRCRAHPGPVAPDLDEELEAELDILETAWPAALPRGIVHADLFPDNVLFTAGQLTGMIDFYFACTDVLAYDLAVAVNAWCFDEAGRFELELARSLFAAYRRRRPLADAEVEALPVLIRGAAIRFLLTRLHDWLHVPKDAMVTPKNPAEYVQKLRFHRTVHGPAGYGL